MKIILSICFGLISICFIALFICFYFLLRNIKVYNFRVSLIGTKNYDNLPSYEKMVYSIKPLKEKYWIKS